VVAGDKIDFTATCEVMKILPTAANYADAKTVDNAFKAGAMLCMDMTDMKVKDKCTQPHEMPCSGGEYKPEAQK
jgi:hypothetical protein